MGIESDRLVYDYLSRVGDLAQQQGLPSRDRMRLVATLRAEIDQRRAGAGAGGQSEAGVKRILGKLGTPTEVVAKAGDAVRADPAPDDARGGGVPDSGGYGDDALGGGAYVTDRPKRAFSAGGSGGTSAVSGPGRGHGDRDGQGGASSADRTAPSPGFAATTPGVPAQPESVQPESVRPESVWPGSARPESVRPGSAQPESTWPEPGPSVKPRRKPARTARERLAGFAERSGLTGKAVPGPRAGDATPSVPEADRSRAASSPHLAGEDELSSRESDPDWWRTDPGPFAARREAPFGAVEGFTGGIEIPELLAPPPGEDDGTDRRDHDADEDEEIAGAAGAVGAADSADGVEQESDGAYGDAAADAGARRPGPGLLRRALRRRRGGGQQAAEGTAEPAGAALGGPPSGRAGGGVGPLLLVAIALLLAGAVIGNVIVLACGWLIAYTGGRLSRQEAKLAVMGIPGFVASCGVVWLWGRMDGRWGDPIPEDGLGDAMRDVWPVVVRTAAIASALFLVWRSRRRPRG
ncbi:hypothetical protein [Streptomyces sp. XD-27]|uniref:hypothetical protein n=1 Tax=Streptomyces sp. XD-27 TaxID=3062779 RepID=UPI0026F44387|nr:hypothetical protein [Streptomyces sp. XD-27]WKX71026.1 hypothetical protein Q3Y56_14910 [Streptomyces sp. XD-27]